MIKLLVFGVWVCLATLGSSYAAAYWASGRTAKAEEPYLEGLEYRKLEVITVPMVSEGIIQGYVVAKLVYTADAAHLREMKIEPDPFVVDEAFREIYTNGQIEFGKLSKYNLPQITAAIKENTNKRLNYELIEDILLEGLNYIDRKDVGRVVATADSGNDEKGKGGGGHDAPAH